MIANRVVFVLALEQFAALSLLGTPALLRAEAHDALSKRLWALATGAGTPAGTRAHVR